MPLDLSPGVIVPIPCRACGKAMAPFKVEAGRHSIACSCCKEVMTVLVSLDEDDLWRIRTHTRGGKAADPVGR